MYVSTLAEVFDAIEPRIDKTLVDGACLSRIRSIAGQLPSRASDFMGFERVLGCDNSGVDYALGLSDHGANWLLTLCPWPVLRRPLADVQSYLDPTGPRPWLEFDIRDGAERNSMPSLYVGLDPASNQNAARIGLARALTSDTAIPIERIAGCIEALPDSFNRLYLGAMFSRPSRGIRISVGGLNAGELLTYLKCVDWPGDLSAVDAILGGLSKQGRRFGLQIDVAHDVDRWLGIELMLDEPYPGSEVNVSDMQLLDDLLTAKRCTSAERTALLSWPARLEFTAPIIDRYIDARCPKPGQRLRHGTVKTAIHHYKLSFKRDGSIETKAYFGLYIELG